MIGQIKIDGFTDLLQKTKKLSQDLQDETRTVITTEAQNLASRMKFRAPRDEGNLAEAIESKVWKLKTGVVGAVAGITHEAFMRHPEFKGRIKRPHGKHRDYYYPASQEYGWTAFGKHYPGHPYIRPSWDERKLIIQSRIRYTLKRVIETVKPI